MKKLLLALVCAMALVLGACSMNDIRDVVDNSRSGGSSESPAPASGDEGDEFSDDEYAYEDSAEKLAADLTLCNNYLGLSYTIPANWWLYDINYDNLDENASATTDAVTLDIYFGDGYSYLDLAYFGSLQYSSRDNHIGIDLSAEQIEGVDTLDDYMDEYIAFMLEPYEGDTYELLEESSTTMQGREFYQCLFEVGQEGRPYHVLTMTCAVNDGYFFTMTGNYWPDNKKAVENILQYMDNGLNFL